MMSERFLVLEDAAVGRPRQQPEPGPEQDAVTEVDTFWPEPLGFDKDAVELPLLSVHLHFERALLADRFVEIDVIVFAQAFDAKLEQLAQPFGRFEARENENVLAERGGELADASILGKLPGHVCEKPH